MRVMKTFETGRGPRVLFGIALIGFVLALGVLEAVTSHVLSGELASSHGPAAQTWLSR